MMSPKNFCTGLFYGNDSWKNYWEGSLKRDNQNIGTLTTQNITWMGVYGVNSKVSVLAMLPYVWTKASGGTLHGMQGLQDLTVGAKYNFLKKDIGSDQLNFYALGLFSMPVTNYTPDFLPLSIGLGSKNLSARFTSSYRLKKVWKFSASGAYTYRSNITLDRPSYYTNGQLYFTNEVQMFNLFDYVVRAGYHKSNWHAEVFYVQQNTLGGSDIRRQDMPFASNQMNFSKAGVSLLLDVPHVKNLTARCWSSYTLAGRNVGQSFSVMAGLMYNIPFSQSQQ
ncbi:MAG: transporter [Bacteroidetes bacterium]|nr:transporter [Bacteroidota bacterium]